VRDPPIDYPKYNSCNSEGLENEHRECNRTEEAYLPGLWLGDLACYEQGNLRSQTESYSQSETRPTHHSHDFKPTRHKKQVCQWKENGTD